MFDGADIWVSVRNDETRGVLMQRSTNTTTEVSASLTKR
jgi:hypothetical protein